MSKAPIELPRVFESDVEELLAMQHAQFITEEAQFYASAMLAYLTSNKGQLQDVFTAGKTLHVQQRISLAALLCTQMRVEILTHEIHDSTRKALEAESEANPAWRGELEYQLALAAEVLKEHERCATHNLKSRAAFLDIGSKKKAVRALHNHMAAKSRMHPERHCIPDYNFAYREAKKTRDASLMGMILINLSVEYQRLGALTVAFQHANRAVLISSKNAGNLTHNKALLNRANLYLLTNCVNEARRDVEAALPCESPVIQAAITEIRKKYPDLLLYAPEAKPVEKKNELISIFWRDRNAEGNPAPLGKLEQALLVFLADGPRQKEEITLHLYGDKIDPLSAENRLKNLLNRIRKRHKNMIVFAHGYYRLGEEPFIEAARTTKSLRKKVA